MCASPFEERMPHVLMSSPRIVARDAAASPNLDTTAAAALPINFGLETASEWFNLVYAR